MALLDTRDAELCLWQGATPLRSPGFVLLEHGAYRFGESAQRSARLRPRDINNRYWFQLSTQPLQPSLGAARHTADLVHSHLRDLHAAAGAPESVTLAVSDAMPREQLSLLLGVAGACDFTTAGLVSRAVLLGSAAAIEGPALQLELQLHQAIINELDCEGGEVFVTRSSPLPSCGLLALQERALGAISSAFIQQTRYDPRRSAESEQALYNELPKLLAALATQGEHSVELNGQRCRITTQTVAGVGNRLCDELSRALSGRDIPVIADRQIQQLAGPATLPGTLVALPDDALWTAFAQHAPRILGDGDALHLVDRLPVDGAAKSAAAVPAAAAPAQTVAPAIQAPSTMTQLAQGTTGPAATHLLLGTRALPLRGDQIELGGGYQLRHEAGQWTLHGSDALINGLPATARQPLILGDTLSLGSAGHGRLIEVVD